MRSRGGACALLAVGALLTLGARRAGAQATGRIVGTVTEAVATRPVSAVTISIVRDSADSVVPRDARPNAKGEYAFDAVAQGHYVMHVTSPTLDSLDLSLPDREVIVESGRAARVDHAMPSGATLRDAVCPGLTLGRGKGVVAGHARSAENEQPFADAEVVVAWTELVVDRATLKSAALEHAASSKTGARGEYRLCGVPTSTWLTVQLQRGELSGSAIRVMVSDQEGAIVRDLSMSVAAASEVNENAKHVGGDSSAAEFLLSGTATLTGVVRGAGNVPLAGAQVRVQDARGSAITDSLGRFSLGGLPEGTQTLLARRIGYTVSEVPVELRGGVVAVRDVQLVRAVTLDTIVVSDYRSRYREFEFNRGMYFMAGDFMTSEMIARRTAAETGELIDRMPGFTTVGHGGVARAYTRKSLRRNAGCPANVVVDGVEEMGVNDVPPSLVEGIEVYVNPPKPSIYHRVGCGVVVIWTKNWRRPTREAPVRADSAGRSSR